MRQDMNPAEARIKTKEPIKKDESSGKEVKRARSKGNTPESQVTKKTKQGERSSNAPPTKKPHQLSVR